MAEPLGQVQLCEITLVQIARIFRVFGAMPKTLSDIRGGSRAEGTSSPTIIGEALLRVGQVIHFFFCPAVLDPAVIFGVVERCQPTECISISKAFPDQVMR